MFHVVLYQPEIPPNTGNIIRLCANAGANLHLIEPLGFSPDDSKLRRAGLDYHDWTTVRRHRDLDSFFRDVAVHRLFTVSTHNPVRYTDAEYERADAFLFGPETRGLPTGLRDSVPRPRRLTLPMTPNNRSLNLSNAVAIVLFEAWRQQGFAGAR
jgi:tRNA (cytidine/uridine-2'-O-)-methyltransferase